MPALPESFSLPSIPTRLFIQAPMYQPSADSVCLTCHAAGKTGPRKSTFKYSSTVLPEFEDRYALHSTLTFTCTTHLHAHTLALRPRPCPCTCRIVCCAGVQQCLWRVDSVVRNDVKLRHQVYRDPLQSHACVARSHSLNHPVWWVGVGWREGSWVWGCVREGGSKLMIAELAAGWD